MSRWFPEHVVLRIGDAPRALPAAWPSAPDGVDATLAGGGSAGQSKCDAALRAFEHDLDQRGLKRGTRITCVVAGDGVRYRVVPWNEELAGPAQRQLLAEHCFKEAYGDAARGWTVRQHTVRHGAASLACALDAALLDRLDAMAQARRLELVSVQPSLMHACNQAPPRLEPGPFWFVCIETLWTTALLMSPTEPLHVKPLPSAGLDLSLSLDCEGFALGLEGPRCPVHAVQAIGAPASPDTAGARASGWRSVDLHGNDVSPRLHRRAA